MIHVKVDVTHLYPMNMSQALALEPGTVLEAQDGTKCLVTRFSPPSGASERKVLIGFFVSGPLILIENIGPKHFKYLGEAAHLVLQ